MSSVTASHTIQVPAHQPLLRGNPEAVAPRAGKFMQAVLLVLKVALVPGEAARELNQIADAPLWASERIGITSSHKCEV